MASTEYAWPRRSSLTRSPDTLSPVYPDRPIRPLPKNRLKSRLSPEQTASLIYPPDPPISSLSFNFPFGAGDKADARAVDGHGSHYVDQPHCTCGGDHGEAESEEEEVLYDHPNFRVQSPVEGAQQRRMMENQRAAGKPAPPASIASSADGYESFENTSNKKKRKIPLSGSSGVHQSSLTSELANMGISPHGGDGANDDIPSYSQSQAGYSTAAPGMGHAGAGRGRSSKASPIRRRGELVRTVSVPASHTNGYSTHHSHAPSTQHSSPHTYTPSVNPTTSANTEQTVERGGAYKGDGTKISKTLREDSKTRPDPVAVQPQPAQEHKIISTAIANAQSQPTTPQKGKENVSLLEQSPPTSTTPKTQFTFTCESDSSNKMVWPGQGQQPPYTSPTPAAHQQQQPQQHQQYPPFRSNHAQTTQGTQTNIQMRGANPHAAGALPQPPYPQQQNGPNPSLHANTQAAAGAQAAPPLKLRRRRPSREYALAARNRRFQQEYANYHHKPTKESMWICEFCEYEDLFGRPPEALIRQYEIKDRAERKRQEEKRRLLEKAKMKGRKAKKGAKGQKNQPAPAQQNGAQPQQQQQQHHQGQADYHHDGAQGLQDHGQHEEYYDDEYDEGYDPVSPDEAHQDRGGGHQPQYDGYDYSHGPPQPPDKAGVGGPAPEADAVGGASA